MDRPSDSQWFPALLTAGCFLTMVMSWVFGLLDALGGSASCQLEFALGFACGVSFMSLLAVRCPAIESGHE
jgi:hypothetical protein